MSLDRVKLRCSPETSLWRCAGKELGRITSVTGIDGTYADQLAYEPTGRIAEAQYPTTATTLERTREYGEANRIDQTWTEAIDRAGALANTTYTFDAAGNRTSLTDHDTTGTGAEQIITWDAPGKVETITATGAEFSSTGAVSGAVDNGAIEFFYDADGTRIMRSTDDAATLYVHGVEITLDKSAGALATTRAVDLPGGATRRYSDPYGNNLDTITTAADGTPEWLGQGGLVKGTIDPTGHTHIGARDYNTTTGIR